MQHLPPAQSTWGSPVGMYYISFGLVLIPQRGGVSHSNPSSPILSIAQYVLFLIGERLHVLLYDVSPSLLLLSSTAAFVDLCRHNSFHGVFVLPSHHMIVPSQSLPLVFCQ